MILCVIKHSTFLLTQYLLVQSQLWKHQNNVWDLSRVNNEDTIMTSLKSFLCFDCWLWTDSTHYSSASIVDFEQVNTGLIVFSGVNKPIRANRKYWLTLFMPLVSFNTSWKHQKTRDFLIFSGCIERYQFYEIIWPKTVVILSQISIIAQISFSI